MNTFQGRCSTLNITQPAVVKQAPGRIARVVVLVAGTAPGSVNDSLATTGNSAANQVAPIPAAVGSYLLDMACFAGICVVPGTGQTLAVSFD